MSSITADWKSSRLGEGYREYEVLVQGEGKSANFNCQDFTYDKRLIF